MSKSKRNMTLLLLFVMCMVGLVFCLNTNASAGTVTASSEVSWGLETGSFKVNGIPAFCSQYVKKRPPVGTQIQSIVPCTNVVMRKALYYGYNGPKNTLGTDAKAHVLTAIALSDANIGEAETGVKAQYDAFYWDLVNNPEKYPAPPDNFKTYFANTASSSMQNLVFYEMEQNGYAKAIKVSASPDISDGNSCYSFEGAKYGLYSSSTLEENSRVGTWTIDAKGNSNTIELVPGVYYARELEAPKGFALSKEVIQFSVTEGSTTLVKLTDEPQVNPIEILIQKVDEETGQNKPQGEASLKGAQFQVRFYPGLWEKDQDPESLGQKAIRSWVFETDEEGSVYYTEEYKISGDELYQALPLGTVTIREIKASEGYKINSTVYIRQITATGTEKNISAYQYPQVAEKIIKMKVRKLQKGTEVPIPNVAFEHIKPDGSIEELYTDENGMIIISGLDYGEHKIREKEAAKGYVMNEEVYTFTMDESTTEDLELIVNNMPAPYDVIISKTDSFENVLEGAEFALYSDAECQNQLVSGITDAEGILRLENLEVGMKYYLKETKAPAGYQVPVGENGEHKVYEIYAKSTPIKGEFDFYIDGVLQGYQYDQNRQKQEVHMKIVNDIGFILPQTGTPTRMLMTIAGIMLCSMSAYQIIRKKEKKHMKKVNLFIATLLSATILFGVALPANAASAEVNIEVKATAMDNVSVTVPTSIPIVFNADGSNTLPTNWTIENKSTIAGIHLSEIDMSAENSGWSILAETQDTKKLAADTKAIQFFVGKADALKMVVPTNGTEDVTGSVDFEESEIAIASGESQVLSFDVNRGAFTQDLAAAKAFNMVLTFEFN